MVGGITGVAQAQLPGGGAGAATGALAGGGAPLSAPGQSHLSIPAEFPDSVSNTL